MIFESRQPIVAKEECLTIIEEAKATIQKGLAQEEETPLVQDGRSRTNSQLGEARLSGMPKAQEWLRETLHTKFYPLLESRFGIPAHDLVLYDGLVLGVNAPSRSQPIHRDASLLTLNVALSPLDNYQGGGTYIEAVDETLKIEQGHLLCHAGSAMHAGVGISSGQRWVLVLFVLSRKHPQIARRCHAQALECLDRGDLELAEHVLQIGLEAAPHDHLLHNTMGRLHITRDNDNTNLKAAFRSFQKADEAYPVCPKAIIFMAQSLMDRRRFRAALRRFDTVLEDRIQKRDLQPAAMMSLKSMAWAARRDAARCALVCAEYMHSKPGGNSWARRHLPVALDRIHTCLVPAPNEPNLLGMLKRAEELLEEATDSD